MPFVNYEHGNALGSRPQLTQEPKLLRRKFHRHEADTSDVAAGPVEVGDEAIPNRVAPGHKDDRHRRGCGLGRKRARTGRVVKQHNGGARDGVAFSRREIMTTEIPDDVLEAITAVVYWARGLRREPGPS